ncbi:MAG: DUF5668 domain-containing protein [Coriobacteriia bacterium]|nr:DUF5668 domain-containing protein [Coriobacteriia bacterium]
MSDTTPTPASEAPVPPPVTPIEPTPAAAAPTYTTPPPYVTPEAPQQPAAGPVDGGPVKEARSGGIIGGIVLIVLGGIFLAGQFLPGIDISKLWPLILIGIGVGIIVRRR